MGKGHRDKVAVVSGAAEGLGQAFAVRLAEDGAHVALVDRKGADGTAKKAFEDGFKQLITSALEDPAAEQAAMALLARGKTMGVNA